MPVSNMLIKFGYNEITAIFCWRHHFVDTKNKFGHNFWDTNPIFKKIGADVHEGAEKVLLPYPMKSLEKVKPHTRQLVNWLERFIGPYFISEKLVTKIKPLLSENLVLSSFLIS